MLDGILWFCILLNLACVALNARGCFRLKKAEERCNELWQKYLSLIFETKRQKWLKMGAYEAENGKMYLDLEGGLRLVIFEGKIDGWYFP